MLNIDDWLDEHESPQNMHSSFMYVRSDDVRELVDQIRRELSEPVASVPQDVETWIAAKKYYTSIARPEEMDGTESVSVAKLREFLGAWMAGHVRVPVALRMKRLDETIFVDYEPGAFLFAEQGWAAESIYIIPDTHRVVSVELLAIIEGELSISDYWTHNRMGEEIRAIIDNKEQS